MDEVLNKSCLLGSNQRSAQIIDRSPTYNSPKLIKQFTHQGNNFSEYGIDETTSKNCRYNQRNRVNEMNGLQKHFGFTIKSQ